MKHIIFNNGFGLVALLAVALTGCQRNRSHPDPVEPQSPAQASAGSARGDWWVSYAGAGPHPFVVRSDGRYVVGPGPDGQSLYGEITPDESREIEAILPPAPVQGCGPSETSFWVDGSKPGPACSSGLESAARKLAAKYYPSNFPSPCVDAAHALRVAYASVSRCERDSDCSYVDESLSPVGEATKHEPESDACGYVKPLAVANAFEAVAHQLPLVLKRDVARRLCAKEPPLRTACGLSGASSLPKPTCLKGYCRGSGASPFLP